MARQVETVVRLVDDLDGGKAQRTITFAIDGATYEIDLSSKNARAFEKVLEPYVQAGRRVRTRGGRRGKRSGGVSNALVREWAANNGVDVSPRGRVPQSVVEAYEAAQSSK